MEPIYYTTRYQSPIGEILLAGSKKSIIGLWIERQKYFAVSLSDHFQEKNDCPVLLKAEKWLDDYFAGKKPPVSKLSLAPIGSEFRQIVWKILMEIPYGETRTYGGIAQEAARRMGKQRMASQAVGGAVGHNPIAIIIPCHRVIGANGDLTGYAGGIDLKIKLLDHEGAKYRHKGSFSRN